MGNACLNGMGTSGFSLDSRLEWALGLLLPLPKHKYSLPLLISLFIPLYYYSSHHSICMSSSQSSQQMAAHIVPFPSLSHSLSSLQYATNIQNVPIYHQGPNGRSAESEEKVRTHLIPFLASWLTSIPSSTFLATLSPAKTSHTAICCSRCSNIPGLLFTIFLGVLCAELKRLSHDAKVTTHLPYSSPNPYRLIPLF